MSFEQPVISVIGDIARDVNVRIDVRVPNGLVRAGDTPAQVTTGLGGSASATAAWLAYRGESVRLIGARGDDFAGAATVDELRRLGIEPRLHIVTGAVTGTVVVLVDPTGERTMLPDPGANTALSAPWCFRELTGKHLHVSAYPWFRLESRRTIEAVVDHARAQGMTVSIDLNSYGLVRDHLAALPALLDRADVVFANRDEWHSLGQGWTTPPSTVVVVKLGASGARWSRGPDSAMVPAVPVSPIDSTGSGDAFAAGFLSIWVGGGAIEDSVAAGNATAALCVTRVGPAPDFPD